MCFPQWHVSPKELFLTLTSIVETSRFLIPFPNIWSKSMMVTLEAISWVFMVSPCPWREQPVMTAPRCRSWIWQVRKGWSPTRMDRNKTRHGIRLFLLVDFFLPGQWWWFVMIWLGGFISWAVGVALYLSCWSHNPIIVWGHVDSCSMGTGWEGGFVDGFGECSRFQAGCRSLVARMSHEVCFNNSYIDHGPWWCVS